MENPYEIRVPALEVRQGPRQRLYSFAIDGKLLGAFITVSRVKRSESGAILGYQRPEVISHIAEIRNYIESEDPMIPNALVVAFDDRVKFEPTKETPEGSDSRPGTLTIPIDPQYADEDKPGWVVDGQQRLAAIREAEVQRFPICVISFVASDETEQREQFILVNSTKPLPKGLIYELLPSTDARLPSLLHRRRFPSYLLARLNSDEASPLRGMISTPTNPEGIIKDNSILRMVENSLNDGALYKFRNPGMADGDVESMLQLLTNFWGAVSEVFPDSWGLSPRRSRLMHGAGITSLGFVMDAIADRLRDNGNPSRTTFCEELKPLKGACRWCDGFWDFGPGVQRRWNEIQNTSKDIQLLTNFLLLQYRSRNWHQERPQG